MLGQGEQLQATMKSSKVAALCLITTASGLLVVYFATRAQLRPEGPATISVGGDHSAQAPDEPRPEVELATDDRGRRAVTTAPRDESGAEGRAAQEDDTTPSMAMSALGLAFPDIAEQVELDGVPLWQLELDALSYDDLKKVLGSALALASAEERRILESIPRELRIHVALGEARQLHAESPESYFVRDRSVPSNSFSDIRHVELTADLSRELVQLSEVTKLLGQQPAYFEGSSEELLQAMKQFPTAVVNRWEWSETSQQWIGYDALGAEAAHVPAPSIGKP